MASITREVLIGLGQGLDPLSKARGDLIEKSQGTPLSGRQTGELIGESRKNEFRRAHPGWSFLEVEDRLRQDPEAQVALKFATHGLGGMEFEKMIDRLLADYPEEAQRYADFIVRGW